MTEGFCRFLAAALACAVLGGSARAEGFDGSGQDKALDSAFDKFLAAIKESKEFVEHHPFYRDPANRASGMAFISHLLIRTLEEDVVQDPEYPLFRVLDYRIREGGDNPDQRYLMAPIKGGETYRVWGTLGKQRRLDFQIYAGIPYIKGGGHNASNLAMENIKFDKDGHFEVILSPQKTDGNWMANPPDATKLLVRQVFSDWKNESPGEVHIDRVGHEGSLKPVLTESEMADKLNAAAQDLSQSVEVWPDFVLHQYVQAMPANILKPMEELSAGGGVKGRWMSEGHFDLQDDEALVLTTWPMSGNYQGVQLADVWFSSLEYANRQTSLTADQAYKTRDGAFHIVISAKNPGVQNWLDTTGLRQGVILLRFDGMTEAAFPKDKQPTIEKVKLNELRAHLPPDTPQFTPEMLSRTIAERLAHVQRRFGD